MNDSNDEIDLIGSVVESFLARHRAGERPELEEYLARHPELSDRLPELLATLRLLEHEELPGAGKSDITSAAAVEIPRQLGEFRIIREIGRGGMGVVYQALQTSLDRHVALKVLPRTLADDRYLERFRIETRSASRIHHTNIVQVFGCGEHEGYHYFAMQYIVGQTLADVIKEVKRFREQGSAQSPDSEPASRIDTLSNPRPAGIPTREPPGYYYRSVAQVGLQAAEALAHAHGEGILHLDIKPGNLMVEAGGKVWVADFGLARFEEDPVRSTDVSGTLRYMAPERFAGQSEKRSDVYSLGVTLYEMLALRPPFEPAGLASLNTRILRGEFRALREVDPAIPRDLAAIVVKAMARSITDRYASARLMAEDLASFLAFRPIQARRSSPIDQARKLAQRQPVLACLSAVTAVILGVFATYILWSYARIREEKIRAVAESYRAGFSETRLLRANHPEGWQDRALVNLGRLAGLDTPLRDPVALRGEAVACLLSLEAHETLRLKRHDGLVWSVAFSPDGRSVATMDHAGSIRLWDAVTGRMAKDAHDPEPVVLPPFHRLSPRPTLRFHPGGRFLAYSNWRRRIGFLSLDGGSAPPGIPGPDSPCRDLSWDGSGTLIAATWANGRVSVHEARTGQARLDIEVVPPEAISRVDRDLPDEFDRTGRLSPDGRFLAFQGPGTGDARVYSIQGDRPPIPLTADRDQGKSACFSPDGEVLACGGMDDIRLWDIKSGRLTLTLEGHIEQVQDLAFNQSGDLLASVGVDQTARIWDPRTGRQLLVIRPKVGMLLSVAFSPDGARLAVGGENVAVVYQLTGRGTQRGLARRATTSFGVAFHPREPRLASGVDTGEIIIDDVGGGPEIRRWQAYADRAVYRLAFDSSGERIAAGPSTLPERVGVPSASAATMKPSAITIWEAGTGKLLATLSGHSGDITSLGFDPSGGRVVSATADGSVLVHEVKTGRIIRSWRLGRGFFVVGPSAVWLGDGSRLAIADHGGQIQVIDMDQGVVLRETRVARGVVRMIASTDSSRLVVTHYDGNLSVLSLPELEVIAEPEGGHFTGVIAARFGGRLLATGSLDGQVNLWDTTTWKKLYSFPVHEYLINDLSFGPGGRNMAIADNRGAVTIWNLERILPTLIELGLDRDLVAAPRQPTPPQGGERAMVRSRGLGPIWNMIQPWMAVRFMERCFEVMPAQAQVADDLAWLLVAGPKSIRDARRGLDIARKAVALSPENPLCRNTLAMAYYRVGKLAEALAELEIAGRTAPPSLKPYDAFLRAMIYRDQGQLDRARTWFKRGTSYRADQALSDPFHAEELEQIQAELDDLWERPGRIASPPDPGRHRQHSLN